MRDNQKGRWNRMATKQSEVIVKGRTNNNTKERVEKILKDLGMSMSTAINIYMQQIVHHQGLPFELKLPSDETRKALNEDLKNAKRYSNTKDIWSDIGIDPKANA